VLRGYGWEEHSIILGKRKIKSIYIYIYVKKKTKKKKKKAAKILFNEYLLLVGLQIENGTQIYNCVCILT